MKFDYKKFKKEMTRRGHSVHKNGKYIIIEPNNNYISYGRGFRYADEIIEDIDGIFEVLKFKTFDHFNTFIYSVKYEIIEGELK